jgi:hypothetical protein
MKRKLPITLLLLAVALMSVLGLVKLLGDQKEKKALDPPVRALSVRFRRLQQQQQTEQRRRVVLLAGPHKTGSTTIQFGLFGLDHIHKLGNWSYPMPTVQALQEGGEKLERVGGGSFSILERAFRDQDETFRQNMKRVFGGKFLSDWNAGKNLVIACEALDQVLNDRHFKPEEYFEHWMSIMPWKGQPNLDRKNLEVVVMHRYPRFKHLLSVWHETDRERQLSVYLQTHLFKLFLFFTDAMGVADFYLNHDLPVTIVDTSSGNEEMQVILCDVLQVPNCDSIFSKGERMRVSSRSETDMDLSESQLQEIDRTMKAYDCRYQHKFLKKMEEKKLVILHQTDLFKNCDEPDLPMIRDRHELANRIIKIAERAVALKK